MPRHTRESRREQAEVEPAPLTHDQLAKLASLVASGQEAFPASLPTAQMEELFGRVRKGRRDRLVKFIAGAIAADIQRGEELKLERVENVTADV